MARVDKCFLSVQPTVWRQQVVKLEGLPNIVMDWKEDLSEYLFKIYLVLWV